MAGLEPSAGALRRGCAGFDAIAGWIDRVARVAIGAALLCAFGLLLFQVLVRYILPFPVAWLEEAATYLSGYMAMIGASVCLRAGYHLQVDLLRDALPVAAQHILIFVQNLLVFGFRFWVVPLEIRHRFCSTGCRADQPIHFFHG